MKLQVVRTQFGKDATNGMLFIDGVFECFTLEDQEQAVKIHSETAIPLGTYNVVLRQAGNFDKRYVAKYGSTWHKGMLWIQDVPGFEWILIHTGNTDEHTAGCLLVGETQQDLDKGKDGFVGGSGDAYKKMYPKVRNALQNNDKVTIEYTHINLDGATEAPTQTSDDDKLDKILKKVSAMEIKLRGRII